MKQGLDYTCGVLAVTVMGTERVPLVKMRLPSSPQPWKKLWEDEQKGYPAQALRVMAIQVPHHRVKGQHRWYIRRLQRVRIPMMLMPQYITPPLLPPLHLYSYNKAIIPIQNLPAEVSGTVKFINTFFLADGDCIFLYLSKMVLDSEKSMLHRKT